MRRSPPSGRNETIDADHGDAGEQWSHGAEMPTTSLPSGAWTIWLTSPTPAGQATTVRCVANRAPARPLYASTCAVEAT